MSLLLLKLTDILEIYSRLVMKCCYHERSCVFPFRIRQVDAQEKAPARDIILSPYIVSLFFLPIYAVSWRIRLDASFSLVRC